MSRWLVLIIYNLFLIVLVIPALVFLWITDGKFRQSLPVRFRLFRDLKALRAKVKSGEKLIWIHSASMGEFEQARPLITELRSRNSSLKILATFMSPSGYEARKNYPDADLVQYIPLDTPWMVTAFYVALRPDVGIIIRYEFWPNLILLAKSFNIPLFMINGSLKPNAPYGKIWARWFFHPIFSSYQKILTVSEIHTTRYKAIVPLHPFIKTMGDTRFDQVIKRSKDSDELVTQLTDTSRLTVVIGSSWEDDEKRIFPAFLKLKSTHPELRLIIVPHEIHDEAFSGIQSVFTGLKVSKFSEWTGEPFDVLWVNAMGKLIKIYQACSAAYVGGGFGAGIHNILEPAVYGIPVAHGPKYFRSPEAMDMQAENITTVIQSEADAEIWLNSVVLDEKNRIRTGKLTRDFVFRYEGVTAKIVTLVGG